MTDEQRLHQALMYLEKAQRALLEIDHQSLPVNGAYAHANLAAVFVQDELKVLG